MEKNSCYVSEHKVEILSSSMVTPEVETPIHGIKLSNFDTVGPLKSYTSTIYVYKRGGGGGGDDDKFNLASETLKAALAKALVPFYPWVGRLDFDHNSQIEVQCDSDGVKFVEARCDLTIDEFGDFSPSQELRDLLVPFVASAKPPCPLFLVQVTSFKCGGICIGVAVHHMIGDGTISIQFINTWSEIARSAVDPTTIPPPLLDRSVFAPRSPLSIKYEHSDRFCTNEVLSTPQTNHQTPSPVVTAAVLLLSNAQIKKLKHRATTGQTSQQGMSTFTAVAAHAWYCVTKSSGLHDDQHTVLSIIADVRRILRPPLPLDYLGNAVMRLPAEATVEEIRSGDLKHIAEIIEATKKMLHDDYVRSYVDFMDFVGGIGGDPLALGRREFAVISWLRLPVYEADFGWGKPAVMGLAELVGKCGWLYMAKNPVDDGGVKVTVGLEEEHMVEFKKLFYAELDEEED